MRPPSAPRSRRPAPKSCQRAAPAEPHLRERREGRVAHREALAGGGGGARGRRGARSRGGAAPLTLSSASRGGDGGDGGGSRGAVREFLTVGKRAVWLIPVLT